MAAVVDNWPDLLDPRHKRIYNDEYGREPDMVGEFYNVTSGDQLTDRVSSAGTFGEMGEFTGTVAYDEAYQGYDTTMTHKEFAQGYQITRLMMEFDQHRVIDSKPRELAASVFYRRQTDAARPFNNATSVDTFFSNNTEGVALASNSHTTTSPNTSTSSGFDNLTTSSLTHTALAAARIMMMDFRDDRGKKIPIMPDTLLVHPNKYAEAYEIVGSAKRSSDATNAANVHQGQYKVIEWKFLSNTNDWALIDSRLMKRWGLTWSDKVKSEFDKTEDFDRIIAKWRTYAIWTNAWLNWRFLVYSNVG